MVSSKRFFLTLVFVILVATNAFLRDVDAAGECGKTPIPSVAVTLSPCLAATGNARAKVAPACCARVGALLKSMPKCLCAILLSPTAKQAGMQIGVAIAIPKRCNIKNRFAGKKCGRYTIP
ncbi:non-specific lipid transfer protein GPI-anchored 15 [Mercurialis annua]|uniref:non-specific lipid transfer protein GPI-anchored 15 n=1 Tax=Mercurialis annua TaxID=3986 RepID=UPI00215EBB98|nr:non-specific lipid transfer protein GPI-anchored 15 [Mercurialis annua]